MYSDGEIYSDAPTGGRQVLEATNDTTGVFTIRSATPFASGDPVYLSGLGGMPEINNRSLVVASAVPVGDNYEVTFTDGGVPVDTSGYGTFLAGGTVAPVTDGGVSGTGVATCFNNLFDTGASNTIAWAAVAGAQRYYVYKLSNGLFGYIGQTQETSFTDDNIGPDISRTPPLQGNPFSGPGKYPAAVGYVEQRRCFAATDEEPAYFWATRSATESNLSYSIPMRDDDAIRFRVAARQRCAIKHIVALGNLVLLSENVEWRVSPASGEVLTPDVSVKPQSYIGAGDATPVVANNNLVFAAARGGHVRELAFNWQAQGFINGDLCLRAPHLFDELTIVDMAESKSPFPIIWCVSSSGKLLGLTYVPEQEIGAWHQHDTQGGLFESVCVVPEGDVDVVYVVVNRGGNRFIERMEPRQSEDDETSFFVDCGVSGIGAPSTTFSGLGHLEGQTVSILADGGVHPPRVVSGGQITLDQPASLVHAGLPITADTRSLPIALEVQGYGQGRPKNVNEVWLRFYRTRGIHVGPTFGTLTEYKPRSTENYDAPPALASGEVKVALSPTWGADGDICTRHTDPLPITIVSVTYGFAVGG